MNKQKRLDLGRKIIESAEVIWELDSLEPIDDITEAVEIINKIKEKN